MTLWISLTWWASGWLGLVWEVDLARRNQHRHGDEVDLALQTLPPYKLAPLVLLVTLLGPIELATVAATTLWGWCERT